MKNNRLFSFIIVAIAYIVATAIGLLIYSVLELDIWLRLLVADVTATIVIFVFSVIFGNASIYDPYWSVQPIVIGVLISILSSMTVYKVLLLAVVCLWGVRLTANWAYTFKNLEHQDWRYTMLNEKTGKIYPLINLLGIHLFPTVVVYLCILPMVYAITTSYTASVAAYLILIISLLAVVLQTISDCQMHYYKKHRKSLGSFIRIGLWKYCRHPNYLGEILMWWGVGLSVLFVIPSMWYLLAGAIVNTIMFLVVSIPMADRRLSKRSGYESYRSETHSLWLFK